MSALSPLPAEVFDRLPPEAQAYLRALKTTVRHRQQRVADLEAQLGQNSTNSSRPPSSDSPAVKRAPPKPSSGRRRGGQPGHPLQARPRLPPDQTHTLKPCRCRRCGRALQGDDPRPLRHQVLELPPIRPTVTEYQLHRLACPGCGTSTCATLPAGVPPGQTGPRLTAAVALLTGGYRLSKRQAETLCEDLLGVPLSAGAVCDPEQHTAQPLAPVVEQLQAHVRTQPANVDETGWRQQRRRAWLWVAVTQAVTLFHLALSRGAKVLTALLGPGYRPVLTSDRYSAYNG